MSDIMAELTRMDNIKQSLKALLPDCGQIAIDKSIEPKLTNGCFLMVPVFFFYMDNPQTSMSFRSLDELEKFVVRKIHALKLLQITTPTPEARTRKNCLRRAWGRLEPRELN